MTKRSATNHTFTEGEEADFRHLLRKTEKFIDALPIGERIDFEALIENGEIIELEDADDKD